MLRPTKINSLHGNAYFSLKQIFSLFKDPSKNGHDMTLKGLGRILFRYLLGRCEGLEPASSSQNTAWAMVQSASQQPCSLSGFIWLCQSVQSRAGYWLVPWSTLHFKSQLRWTRRSRRHWPSSQLQKYTAQLRRPQERSSPVQIDVGLTSCFSNFGNSQVHLLLDSQLQALMIKLAVSAMYTSLHNICLL